MSASRPVCWRCSLDYDWCRCAGADEWIAGRVLAFYKAQCECPCGHGLPKMMDFNWPEIEGERFLNKIARERGQEVAA